MRIPLPQTDLKVFPLCLGGNVFGWSADESQSHSVLDAYLASGGNFIDTADAYSEWKEGNVGGESETIITIITADFEVTCGDYQANSWESFRKFVSAGNCPCSYIARAHASKWSRTPSCLYKFGK